MVKKKKTTKAHWKNIARDSKGRWVKQKNPKTVKEIQTVRQTKKKIESILDDIEKKYEKYCPRCAGDLQNHKIRSGPDKLISVRRCLICNFWLPFKES